MNFAITNLYLKRALSLNVIQKIKYCIHYFSQYVSRSYFFVIILLKDAYSAGIKIGISQNLYWYYVIDVNAFPSAMNM